MDFLIPVNEILEQADILAHILQVAIPQLESDLNDGCGNIFIVEDLGVGNFLQLLHILFQLIPGYLIIGLICSIECPDELQKFPAHSFLEVFLELARLPPPDFDFSIFINILSMPFDRLFQVNYAVRVVLKQSETVSDILAQVRGVVGEGVKEVETVYVSDESLLLGAVEVGRVGVFVEKVQFLKLIKNSFDVIGTLIVRDVQFHVFLEEEEAVGGEDVEPLIELMEDRFEEADGQEDGGNEDNGGGHDHESENFPEVVLLVDEGLGETIFDNEIHADIVDIGRVVGGDGNYVMDLMLIFSADLQLVVDLRIQPFKRERRLQCLINGGRHIREVQVREVEQDCGPGGETLIVERLHQIIGVRRILEFGDREGTDNIIRQSSYANSNAEDRFPVLSNQRHATLQPRVIPEQSV